MLGQGVVWEATGGSDNLGGWGGLQTVGKMMQAPGSPSS